VGALARTDQQLIKSVIIPALGADNVPPRAQPEGRYWELPQRLLGAGTGADPMEMARGELREEAGLDAAKMTYVGHLFEACGYSNQAFHIFLASGLRRGTADLEREEQDLVTRDFALSEVERMIRDGEIKDATTVAALGLLRLKDLL
jgi:ADP-ribose pyrophosphatase